MKIKYTIGIIMLSIATIILIIGIIKGNMMVVLIAPIIVILFHIIKWYMDYTEEYKKDKRK